MYYAVIDGSCGPKNPCGTASYGIIVFESDKIDLPFSEAIKCKKFYSEHGIVGTGDGMSNNVAEFEGLNHIFSKIYVYPDDMTIFSDSALVVNQMKGIWKIKNGLYKSYALEAKKRLMEIINSGWKVNFIHISGDENIAHEVASYSL